MPTTLPVNDSSATELPAVPLPLCMGAPTELWLETIKTHDDVQNFWRGYAIGGAACTVLLVAKVVIIILVF